jgi:hypothetical protein
MDTVKLIPLEWGSLKAMELHSVMVIPQAMDWD